jgi:cell division protein FtsL
MSVAQWLNNLEWQAKGAPRVQGIYSPVAGADGVKRRVPGMGTPEIYFSKPIDNSRLVKVTDQRSVRENRMFAMSLSVLFFVVMVYAFQHLSSIEYGYKIETQKKQREELVDANRALRLEEATLRDPERIDVLARKMGLEAPRADQVQHLENASSSVSPMLASVTDSSIAVIAATQQQ